MNNRYSISISKIFYSILAFLSCWYFYFASSFKLRPFPSLFWIGMAVLCLFLGIIHKTKISKMDIAYLLGMACLIILSIFSIDSFSSMIFLANYIIYYLVARMTTNNCEGESIHSIILFFSLVHLICLFIQVIMPNLYISYILPLLPDSIHTTIIEQMNWNGVYYGFSVQTSMSAMYLSIGVLISAVRAKNERKSIKKLFYIILVGLFLIATFFTQRRGSSAAVLLIVALIYMRMKGNKLSKILFVIIFIVLLAIIGIQNIPGLSGIMNKMNIFIASGTIMNGRDSNFDLAFNALLQKPLFGWGGGQVETAIGYAWLENSYLSILVQIGFVGFLIFYYPYIKLLKNTIHNLKYEENNILDFSLYIQILFVIMSFVENYYGEPQHIFIFFLIVLAHNKKNLIKKI